MSLKIVFVVGICGMVSIAAQSPAVAQTQSLRAMLMHPSVAEAMGDAYGRAIIGAFAKLISDQADANCLKDRKLDTVAIGRSAQAILVDYGNKLVALQSKRVSEDMLTAKLNGLAGAGSAAALGKFANDRRIKDLQRFFRPKLNDNLVDRIVDAFDRYATTRRLLRGQVSPTAGDIGMVVSAAERAISAENAAKKALGSDPNSDRLVDLYASLIDAYELAVIETASLTSSDNNAFTGVEQNLQALCLRIGG